MKKRIRVLLADDHPVFRDGLRQAIQNDVEMEVAAEASDGEMAWTLACGLAPDIIVLDVSMPRLDGLGLARRIRDQKRPFLVIFMTMHDGEDLFNRAMDSGAKGFVLKESAVSEILSAIRAVASGKHYLSPGISQYLVSRHERKETLASHHPDLANLTPAERRILKLISEDRTTKEIAADLVLSPRTVEAHRANISGKLKLHGSHSLLRFAFDHRADL
jgi:DNA-binding NarL/FixJ family response regulator